MSEPPAKTTLGGVAKPKFMPKLQPKKEPAAATAAASANDASAASSSATAAASHGHRQQSGYNRNNERGGRGGGGGGRGGWGGGGRDNNSTGRGGGGGRGRFVIPQGVAFFTGNASAAIPVVTRMPRSSSPPTVGVRQQSGRVGTASGSGTGTSSASGGAKKGAEENAGQDAPSVLPGGKTKIVRGKSNKAPSSSSSTSGAIMEVVGPDGTVTMVKQEPQTGDDEDRDSDQDSDNGMDIDNNVHSESESSGVSNYSHSSNEEAVARDKHRERREEEEPEVWPPVDYDVNAPREIPFGPLTEAMRLKNANKSILAHPDDVEALEFESSTEMMLMQLPSDIRAIIASLPNKSGRIGKMQLMKSGKVAIVTDDGRRFQVHPGLAFSFAQFIASVEVPKTSKPNATDLTTTESNNNAGVAIKSEQPTALSSNQTSTNIGDLHLLGRMTRKVIVCPDYLVGQERKHLHNGGASSAVNMSNIGSHGESIRDNNNNRNDKSSHNTANIANKAPLQKTSAPVTSNLTETEETITMDEDGGLLYSNEPQDDDYHSYHGDGDDDFDL